MKFSPHLLHKAILRPLEAVAIIIISVLLQRSQVGLSIGKLYHA